MRVRPAIAGVLLLICLSACSRSSTSSTGTGTTIPPTLKAISAPPVPRPSASVSIYESTFLADHGFASAQAAGKGIQAALAMTAKQSPTDLDDTFALLEEFGSVLQVNIPDMLNRSQDRPTALNSYLSGLTNITIRAQRRTNDLQTSLTQWNDTVRTKSTAVSALQRSINTALQKKDYATAGAQQQDLVTAQGELATATATQKQTQQILTTFKQLITVAQKRTAAIESNRAILIAGLQVVNIPGIEDLGILTSKNASRAGGTSTNYFGL